MGKRQKGFSLREHAEIARELFDLEEAACRIHGRVTAAYGVSSRIAGLSGRLVIGPGLIWQIRNALDDAYWREYGGPSPYEAPREEPRRSKIVNLQWFRMRSEQAKKG